VKNLHGSHPALEGCLRVTVGTPGENDRFLAALRESLVLN
jgi:histidinol-phosphate aminotransferase